jgi:hypothetical protein
MAKRTGAAICLMRWRARHKECDGGNDPWKCSGKTIERTRV